MSRHELDAPGTEEDPDWDSLYLYRGDDVVPYRPVFTGDVYTDVVTRGRSATFIILQHPCALRLGPKLVPRLLVAEVEQHNQAFSRSQWTNGNFKLMPLPDLMGPETSYVAKFLKIDVLDEGALFSGTRVACLSPLGINLLSQRWVNHNTRAVIPRSNYLDVMVGPFEEADVIEEWIADREHAVAPEVALQEADHWLGQSSPAGRSNREMLEDPESRSQTRRAAREQVRKLNAAD